MATSTSSHLIRFNELSFQIAATITAIVVAFDFVAIDDLEKFIAPF